MCRGAPKWSGRQSSRVRSVRSRTPRSASRWCTPRSLVPESRHERRECPDGPPPARRRARRGRVHARRRGPRAPRGRARGGRLGPLLEIGTYCGKSAIYLGAAAREARHRRCTPSTTTAGRRRTRPAGSTTTSGSSTRGPGAWTRCPWFRRTIEDAGLEDVVIAVIGALAGGRRALGDAARAGVRRRRPRVRRRARRLRGVGAVPRARRRCSCSTTCSRTRPTADRRRSRCGSARSSPATSPRVPRPAASAC